MLLTESGVTPSAVVADDHPAILSKVAEILQGKVSILATVPGGIPAVEAVMRLRPDLLILDIGMPDLNGIEVARSIRNRGLTTKIIFLTVEEDPGFVDAARQAGASYVRKRKISTDLVTAIREELSGRRFISYFNNDPRGLPES